MNPIRPEVAAPWRKMWGADTHPERPWWRIGTSWSRCDGVALHNPALADVFNLDPRGALLQGESYADAIVRIDAEHPVAAPLLLSGQVWVMPSGAMSMVGPVPAPSLFPSAVGHFLVDSGVCNGGPPDRSRGGCFVIFDADLRVISTDGAILVAGPTPWGRDIPWAPIKRTT